MKLSTILTLLLGVTITIISAITVVGKDEFVENLPYAGVIAGLFILYVGFMLWLYEVV